MVEVLKTQRLRILKLILLVQVVVLLYFVFQAIGDGGYFLAHEDEVINYCSAKVFSETGSVQAEGCIWENVSRIGRMNWYGPGYHVFYGTLRNVVGDRPDLFVLIHFSCALLSLVVIFFLPATAESRLLIATALLPTQQFATYIFTYFPETFHVLTSLVLIALLMRADTAEEKSRKNRVRLFVAVVLVLILFRVTTVFWLAALIGISRERKERVKMIALFGLVLIATIVYMRFFTAPAFASDMQKMDRLYKLDILDFIKQTFEALWDNTAILLESGAAGVYFLLGLLAVGIWQWWKTRDRLLASAVLVSTLLVLALIAYYSPNPWYFQKQSAVLVPLLIVGITTATQQSAVRYALVVLTISNFYFIYPEIRTNIDDRRAAFAKLKDNGAIKTSFAGLTEFISPDKDAVVLWCYNEYDFGGTTEALLPFSTKGGKPILYTTNIVSDPSEKQDVRFQLHDKLRVDYLLSRYPVDRPGLRLLSETDFYHFYKIGED